MTITDKDYMKVCRDLWKSEDEADRLRDEVTRLRTQLYVLEQERDAARAALHDQTELAGQFAAEIGRLAPLHVAARTWLTEERRQKAASDELNARLARGESVVFYTTGCGLVPSPRDALEKAIDEAEASL